MLPAAQLKMLRYMRSSEPKGNSSNGNNNNNNINSNNSNGGPGTSPKMATQSGSSHLPQPPPPLSARQALAEAAKLPVPIALRGPTSGHQASSLPAPASSSPKQPQPPQRQLSFQRARSNSDSNRQAPTALELAQQQIWEESSINSMFTEPVAATTRPPRTNAGRYDSPFPQPRTQQRVVPGRAATEEPSAPLLLGDRGILRILPTNNNTNGGGAQADDPYAEQSPFGSPAKHVPVLKHSKYALRDTRAVPRRPSFSDRLSHGNHDDNGVGGSPEQRGHQRSDSFSKGVAGTGGLEQGLGNQRSLYLHDADTPIGRSGLGRPETDDGSEAPSQGDEATNQRTPRQIRSPQKLPLQQPVPQQPPPALPQKKLQESSLPRVGGGGGSRREKKMNRKRRHSPDYDDSMLHSMSYSELRNEPFDHDPAQMAMQAKPASPPKTSLEERLTYYKNKDGSSQHGFFTQMTVDEWDECGDWFLSQFAELSNKIRQKRQAKRKKVAEFEAEVAEREKMVRVKMESIERTLEELKHEGEGMMRGRSVNLG